MDLRELKCRAGCTRPVASNLNQPHPPARWTCCDAPRPAALPPPPSHRYCSTPEHKRLSRGPAAAVAAGAAACSVCVRLCTCTRQKWPGRSMAKVGGRGLGAWSGGWGSARHSTSAILSSTRALGGHRSLSPSHFCFFCYLSSLIVGPILAFCCPSPGAN